MILAEFCDDAHMLLNSSDTAVCGMEQDQQDYDHNSCKHPLCREREREGGREGEREGGREGGREGEREGMEEEGGA